MNIRPFEVHIPESAIVDLRVRLSKTRWPDEIAGSEWRFGASRSYMKELLEYWRSEFDWRKSEDEINSYPNFLASADGHTIHFLHIRGKGKNPIPLVITHGWPGSFLEMLKIVPLLTETEEPTFDVIIPSMIGYGFSQPATSSGCNVRRMADLWARLMGALGYERFGAQGGDFGAGVATALGLNYPDRIIGMHLNYIPGSYVPFLPPGAQLAAEEILFEKQNTEWYEREGAYAHQHWTKPLTLAYGLNDSPAGLCAWIIEKFYSWSDCNGDMERVFTRDELLSNVSLYWFTETIHSSIRLYEENSHVPFRFGPGEFVRVPVGIARFPVEEPFPPRRYIERGYNVRRWTDMPVGGHFAAMEQPRLLSDDVRNFFSQIAQEKGAVTSINKGGH